MWMKWTVPTFASTTTTTATRRRFGTVAQAKHRMTNCLYCCGHRISDRPSFRRSCPVVTPSTISTVWMARCSVWHSGYMDEQKANEIAQAIETLESQQQQQQKINGLFQDHFLETIPISERSFILTSVSYPD